MLLIATIGIMDSSFGCKTLVSLNVVCMLNQQYKTNSSTYKPYNIVSRPT